MSGQLGRRARDAMPATRLGRRSAEREDRGATATEYALLMSFIALIIAVSISFFGDSLSSYYHQIASTVGGWL